MIIEVNPKIDHCFITNNQFRNFFHGKLIKDKNTAYIPTAKYECAEINGNKPIKNPAKNPIFFSLKFPSTNMKTNSIMYISNACEK